MNSRNSTSLPICLATAALLTACNKSDDMSTPPLPPSVNQVAAEKAAAESKSAAESAAAEVRQGLVEPTTREQRATTNAQNEKVKTLAEGSTGGKPSETVQENSDRK